MDTRHHADPAPQPGAQVIDEELAKVAAAIDLVAARPGSRVTLAGLRFGESLLPHVEASARERGIRVRPIWPMGDGPVDLVVEQADA
jgi:hypothetical protein